jgi:hypothetical protein
MSVGTCIAKILVASGLDPNDGRRSSQVDLKLFRCPQHDRFRSTALYQEQQVARAHDGSGEVTELERWSIGETEHSAAALRYFDTSAFSVDKFSANKELVRFPNSQPRSGFSHELRIAHWRKKENGKPQSSDRLCKSLTKYSSPVIEASSGAR